MKNFAQVLCVENWLCFFRFLYLTFKSETFSADILPTIKSFSLTSCEKSVSEKE